MEFNFKHGIYCFIILILISACGSENPSQNLDPQKIIDSSIAYHGGKLYNSAQVEFDFRNRHYTSTRSANQYEYTRSFTDSTNKVKDVLNNNGFYREINNERVELDEKKQNAYSNSVNSVLYFAQLPYGLNDAAVIKKYLGESTIEGKNYHKIQITFKQEGGGEDFQDVFIYWFDQKTFQLDYLAYSYETDGGGMRFRKAINHRRVGGILFMDYINYKPSTEFNLDEIDQAIENGQFVEVSRILNENLVLN